MSQQLSSLPIHTLPNLTEVTNVESRRYSHKYSWFGSYSPYAQSILLFSVAEGSTMHLIYLYGTFGASAPRYMTEYFDKGYMLLRDSFMSALDSEDTVLTTAPEVASSFGINNSAPVNSVLRQVLRDIRGDIIQAWRREELKVYTRLSDLPPAFCS